MSDTSAAIRAAKEVQSDTLAPEFFRQANEWFFKAKREYKFKNFKLAKEYAEKARLFAEQAEFEAIRSGGKRTESYVDPLTNMTAPLPSPSVTPSPYPYLPPPGIPADPYPTPMPTESSKVQ